MTTSFSRRFALVLALVMACTPLSGCDLARNQLKMDRSTNLNFQDYRDTLASRVDEKGGTADAAQATDTSGIPALQAYVAPPSENLKPMPLVSISVNQTVPLRDALFELAKQADYDIELDPRIAGSVIFTAREKPFDMVIKRISEIAGLRYKFEDDVLRVELDTPYNKTYKIDYLSYIRTNSGSISNDVSVVSGEGTNTGSNFEATSSSESNFWSELDANMAQILGVAEGRGTLRTTVDPQITAVETPAPVEGAEGQPTQAVLQVSSLPTEGLAAPAAGEAGSPSASSFAMNRQAGMVSVFATERQHEQVREYLRDLRRSVTSQVLIEAKILEVSLSDEFSSGIDWSLVGFPSNKLQSLGFQVTGTDLTPAFDPVIAPVTDFAASFVSEDFTAAVQAISRFGTVHALASPRLTVLNNQSAVLNVANNQVYFELDISTTTEEGITQVDIDSNIRNVPEGVLINVQPSIDLDNRTISMALRPTITRITSFEEDPAVAFVAASADPPIEGISSRIPSLNVQEMDSVIKMGSGQAVIMGGLMQDRTDSTQTGVPVLSEVPLLGSLFKTHVDRVNKTELVIFIKATILEDRDGIEPMDRDLYKQFSQDRRPLNL